MRDAAGDAHAARLRRVRRRQVAPHARGRGAPRRPSRPLAARPRLRALVRLLPRRDAPVRAGAVPRQPPRRAAARRTRTATTSPTDLVDHAIEYVEDLRNVDVDKPWLLYLATGACHSPHQAPRRVDRALPRPASTAAGTRGATRTLRPPEGRWACCPTHTELSPRPDWVPAWDSLTDIERRVYARYMEAFAGFLSHADDEIGRLVDRLDAMGELDNTLVIVLSDNGASSEGGPIGSLNDGRVWNVLPRTVEEADERLDEIGGPAHPQQLPVGLDGRRQHAVPAVEARDPRGRRGRPAHRPLAGAASRPAARCAPVRARHRHRCRRCSRSIGIDAARRSSTASRSGRSTASASRRRFDDAGAPERAHRRSTTRCSAAGRSTRTGGRRSPTTRSRSTSPGLDKAPWELYDLRADPSECHDLAAAEPERLAAMVERVVGGGRAQPGAAARQPAVLRAGVRPPAVGRARATATRTGPGRAPVPESVAVNVRGRPHVVTAHVTVPDDLEVVEGVLVVQGSVLGGWSFHLLADGRLVLRAQPRRAGASTASRRRSPALGAGRPHARHPVRAARRRAARRRRGRRRAAR